MAPKSPTDIESDLIKFAIAFQERMNRGDPRAANVQHGRFYRNARLLRSLPDNGADILGRLIAHGNERVRLNAAYLMLPYDAERAVRALDEIARSKDPMVSTSADMTPAEWRAGRLDGDWFMR